jgi:hypothetical protein
LTGTPEWRQLLQELNEDALERVNEFVSMLAIWHGGIFNRDSQQPLAIDGSRLLPLLKAINPAKGPQQLLSTQLGDYKSIRNRQSRVQAIWEPAIKSQREQLHSTIPIVKNSVPVSVISKDFLDTLLDANARSLEMGVAIRACRQLEEAIVSARNYHVDTPTLRAVIDQVFSPNLTVLDVSRLTTPQMKRLVDVVKKANLVLKSAEAIVQTSGTSQATQAQSTRDQIAGILNNFSKKTL